MFRSELAASFLYVLTALQVQELLGSVGGRENWWRRFEPLMLAERYVDLEALTIGYMMRLDLPPPAAAFLSRR